MPSGPDNPSLYGAVCSFRSRVSPLATTRARGQLSDEEYSLGYRFVISKRNSRRLLP